MTNNIEPRCAFGEDILNNHANKRDSLKILVSDRQSTGWRNANRTRFSLYWCYIVSKVCQCSDGRTRSLVRVHILQNTLAVSAGGPADDHLKIDNNDASPFSVHEVGPADCVSTVFLALSFASATIVPTRTSAI